MRDTESKREGQRHRQREKQAPCREPNVGLDPGTPGSCPEPKADAQPLSPWVPRILCCEHRFQKVVAAPSQREQG